MDRDALHPEYSVGEEIAHAITHGLGLVLSVVGLVALVGAAAWRGDPASFAAAAVFGATLILLYGASTLYHAAPPGRVKAILRRCDHAAVYLLIAGTYTPFALVTLGGGMGWGLLALVWGLALLGITLEVAFPDRARRIEVWLALAMGWCAVGFAGPLWRSLPTGGLVLMALGGLAYTVGVLFYSWKGMRYGHTVWHVFVLAGSALHFACILGYVLPPTA